MKAEYFLILICCLFCFAAESFAQTAEQIAFYSDRIASDAEEVRRDALFELRNFETAEASRIAVPALNDSSDIVRATAVRTVIYLPETEAVRLLLPLLTDESPFVRRETAYALGKVGNPAAVRTLSDILQNDKDREVRAAAAVALGEIGDVGAITTLTKTLNRKRRVEEEFIRRSAARAVGHIARRLQRDAEPVVAPESFLPEKYEQMKKPKYRRLVESFPVFQTANSVLIKILQNPKETNDVRREAAFALGEIGDAAAIPVLRANANAADAYLAEISAEALRKVLQNVNFSNPDG
jgi:HEAT repeat protein